MTVYVVKMEMYRNKSLYSSDTWDVFSSKEGAENYMRKFFVDWLENQQKFDPNMGFSGTFEIKGNTESDYLEILYDITEDRFCDLTIETWDVVK